MTSFHVDFLGCKISQTDAETVREALEGAGHVAGEQAHVSVVNTCCITAQAEKKSRQRVRKLLREGADEQQVFVTGCGASLNAKQYTEIDDRVTVLPGAASLASTAIVEAADSYADLGCRGPRPGLAPGHDPARPQLRRARAFVKVQDGCSYTCSYCIVPAVRGKPRSRTVESILTEVARCAARGQHEIVLTGVNIGLYRDDESRISLAPLIRKIAQIDGVERIRISSIEINHVNKRLVEVIASEPKVCPHLHVPMQSGDDAVLAGMSRHYDSARYRRAIDYARSLIPALNLTTDIIVGYPTESDTSFLQTADFAREMGFTKVHAFPYSERPGTASEQANDPIDKATKAERSEVLRSQADALALQHRRRLVGSRDRVVVETRRVAGYGVQAGIELTANHVATAPTSKAMGENYQSMRTGYTRDYSPVVLQAADGQNLDSYEDGQIVEVELLELDEASGNLLARIVG